jgi:hypothetical protein
MASGPMPSPGRRRSFLVAIMPSLCFSMHNHEKPGVFRNCFSKFREGYRAPLRGRQQSAGMKFMKKIRARAEIK